MSRNFEKAKQVTGNKALPLALDINTYREAASRGTTPSLRNPELAEFLQGKSANELAQLQREVEGYQGARQVFGSDSSPMDRLAGVLTPTAALSYDVLKSIPAGIDPATGRTVSLLENFGVLHDALTGSTTGRQIGTPVPGVTSTDNRGNIGATLRGVGAGVRDALGFADGGRVPEDFMFFNPDTNEYEYYGDPTLDLSREYAAGQAYNREVDRDAEAYKQFILSKYPGTIDPKQVGTGTLPVVAQGMTPVVNATMDPVSFAVDKIVGKLTGSDEAGAAAGMAAAVLVPGPFGEARVSNEMAEGIIRRNANELKRLKDNALSTARFSREHSPNWGLGLRKADKDELVETVEQASNNIATAFDPRTPEGKVIREALADQHIVSGPGPGQFDPNTKAVQLGDPFSDPSVYVTSAHELGHSLVYKLGEKAPSTLRIINEQRYGELDVRLLKQVQKIKNAEGSTKEKLIGDLKEELEYIGENYENYVDRQRGFIEHLTKNVTKLDERNTQSYEEYLQRSIDRRLEKLDLLAEQAKEFDDPASKSAMEKLVKMSESQPYRNAAKDPVTESLRVRKRDTSFPQHGPQEAVADTVATLGLDQSALGNLAQQEYSDVESVDNMVERIMERLLGGKR